MEQFLTFGKLKILLTTAQNRNECQAWEWWEMADIVLGIVETEDEDKIFLLKSSKKKKK
jgi:hypothetical protein